MIIVNGAVRFGAGEIDRLRDSMARNVEATRGEDGCEHDACAVDVSDPNLLRVAERWRDDKAIEAISIKAYEASFLRDVPLSC